MIRARLTATAALTAAAALLCTPSPAVADGWGIDVVDGSVDTSSPAVVDDHYDVTPGITTLVTPLANDVAPPGATFEVIAPPADNDLTALWARDGRVWVIANPFPGERVVNYRVTANGSSLDGRLVLRTVVPVQDDDVTLHRRGARRQIVSPTANDNWHRPWMRMTVLRHPRGVRLSADGQRLIVNMRQIRPGMHTVAYRLSNPGPVAIVTIRVKRR